MSMLMIRHLTMVLSFKFTNISSTKKVDHVKFDVDLHNFAIRPAIIMIRWGLRNWSDYKLLLYRYKWKFT